MLHLLKSEEIYSIYERGGIHCDIAKHEITLAGGTAFEIARPQRIRKYFNTFSCKIRQSFFHFLFERSIPSLLSDPQYIYIQFLVSLDHRLP